MDLIYDILGMCLSLINVLPNWTMPQEALDAIGYIIRYALAFEGLFPVLTMFTIFWYILLFESMMWFARIMLSVFNWVRGAGKLEF